MSYPIYIPTRVARIPGSIALESSEALRARVRMVASRSLRWAATEYLFEMTEEVRIGELGGEVDFLLPTTDSAGWRDARSGSFIDVSAPGALTHTYEARVQLLRENGSKLGREFTLGPFTLPYGQGVFVIPTSQPYPTEYGDVVLVPDRSKEYAEQAGQSAESAAADRQGAEEAAGEAQQAAQAAQDYVAGLVPAFEHVQAVPLGSWVIPHTFGRRPHVTVYIDGQECEAAVAATTTAVAIEFATPVAGTAILS